VTAVTPGSQIFPQGEKDDSGSVEGIEKRAAGKTPARRATAIHIQLTNGGARSTI